MNDIQIVSGDWDGENIIINVDGLDLGVHSFTITVSDDSLNEVSDTVVVTVEDTTPPELDHPIDVTYIEGDTGNRILWNPSDLSPSSYEVLRNGSIARSGGWDGSEIEISVDGLVIGQYNYTLVVYDYSGNFASDEVLVTVTQSTITESMDLLQFLIYLRPLLSVVAAAITLIAALLKSRSKKLSQK